MYRRQLASAPSQGEGERNGEHGGWGEGQVEGEDEGSGDDGIRACHHVLGILTRIAVVYRMAGGGGGCPQCGGTSRASE